jgi:hypothetical protein
LLQRQPPCQDRRHEGDKANAQHAHPDILEDDLGRPRVAEDQLEANQDEHGDDDIEERRTQWEGRGGGDHRQEDERVDRAIEAGVEQVQHSSDHQIEERLQSRANPAVPAAQDVDR